MPTDFLQDLTDDLDQFKAADDSQDAGQAAQVGGTADLVQQANKGMKLQAIVKNRFKNTPAILAEWISAQHNERAPQAKKPVPPVG